MILYELGAISELPQNIDPWLFTHVVYAFAKIVTGPSLSKFEWNDEV